jgi:hypothetical protein
MSSRVRVTLGVAVALALLVGAWCRPVGVSIEPLPGAAQAVVESREEGARGALAVSPEAALWGWFHSDLPLRVKAFKLLERTVSDRALYRVVVSAEPDVSLPYGWRSGDNIRWLTLQRVSGGWVIADVANIPPPRGPPTRRAYA